MEMLLGLQADKAFTGVLDAISDTQSIGSIEQMPGHVLKAFGR